MDEVNKRIFGNGFPLKISSTGVSYDSEAGWQSVATGDLSAYTVYGGAEQTDVSSSKAAVASVQNKGDMKFSVVSVENKTLTMSSGRATRAQVATILQRFCQSVEG